MGNSVKKIAVACQGGGMHAAFEVGVLTEILTDIENKNRFDLVGLSGTSAGALSALTVWYGLAPKKSAGSVLPGSAAAARHSLNRFWTDFVAKTDAETLLNFFTFNAFRAEETEVPVLGINAPIFGFNPYGAIFRTVAANLPSLGVRKDYFDLNDRLNEACPEFDNVDWQSVKTRLLIGASEIVKGFETVFDSEINKYPNKANPGMQPNQDDFWRQQLPLSLEGVAASGTLPVFREAQRINDGFYWDGLYSQNPPVREFLSGPSDVPDELWVVRINPQQWPEPPRTNGDIQDRQNELMGNLSLNKELDFILQVNAWAKRYKNEQFGADHKHVIVRTIKMKKKTADGLRYASKFDRSRAFMKRLRQEGREVTQDWLAKWPNVDCYPQDAA